MSTQCVRFKIERRGILTYGMQTTIMRASTSSLSMDSAVYPSTASSCIKIMLQRVRAAQESCGSLA